MMMIMNTDDGKKTSQRHRRKNEQNKTEYQISLRGIDWIDQWIRLT